MQQEALVVDAGVDDLLYALAHAADLVAHLADHALAGGHPPFIRSVSHRDQLDGLKMARMRSAEVPLRAFEVSPTRHHEQVAEVLGLLGLIVAAAADHVAEAGQELQQQRHRVGLGVRQDRRYHLAG